MPLGSLSRARRALPYPQKTVFCGSWSGFLAPALNFCPDPPQTQKQYKNELIMSGIVPEMATRTATAKIDAKRALHEREDA